MSDRNERLLVELGRRLQEHPDATQEALESLVQEGLSDAHLAALRRRAQSDERLQQAVDAYTPLDSQAQTRIADQLSQARMRADDRSQPPPPEHPTPAVRRVRIHRSVVLWPALAAAAGFFLWVTPIFDRTPDRLPTYGYELSVVDTDFRSTPVPQTDVPFIAVGDSTRILLRLRPASPVRTPVLARAFLGHPNHTQPWSGRVTVSKEGAIEMRLEAMPALQPGESTARLIVVAGDAHVVDAFDASHVSADSASTRGPGWQRWSWQLRSNSSKQ